MSNKRREPPKTCKEAADRFLEWADSTSFSATAAEHKARAEILDAFGDAPLPETLKNDWNWSST